MKNSLIIAHEPGCHAANCGICGDDADNADNASTRLFRAQDFLPVCRLCGQKFAPALSVLLELANVAVRVGRITGHSGTWLPLGVLLELTRLCQRYHDLLAEE